MISRMLLETSLGVTSAEGGGAGFLSGQMILVALFVVLEMQREMTRILERNSRGKAQWLLGTFVISLSIATAVILGARLVLLLFGG